MKATQQQLNRNFLGVNFHCDFITSTKSFAKEKQKLYKKVGFFARVVKLQNEGKRVYGLYVNI